MHLSPTSSAVLVLSVPYDLDAASTGYAINELPGVASVMAFPERGQLLVRYDPATIPAEAIRVCLLPEIASSFVTGPWLLAWPRVAGVLPLAASWL